MFKIIIINNIKFIIQNFNLINFEKLNANSNIFFGLTGDCLILGVHDQDKIK